MKTNEEVMKIIEFWERTNRLIKKNRKTQETLSKEIGLVPRRINNLSSGKRFPDLKEAVMIANKLNTTVEFLVTGEEPAATLNFRADLQKVISKYTQQQG